MKAKTPSQLRQEERTYKKWFGKRIHLNTTNFNGQKGTITEIDFNSTEPNCMYGYHIKTRLDSGKVVTSHKFEGLILIQENDKPVDPFIQILTD